MTVALQSKQDTLLSKLSSDKERELMRIVLDAFKEYDRREQHFYLLTGMSTYHITGHAIEDFTTLRTFWPPRLVRHQLGTTIYELDGKTISNVNTEIRKTLQKLVDKGLIEKTGNEHERRWRPVKTLRGVTL